MTRDKGKKPHSHQCPMSDSYLPVFVLFPLIFFPLWSSSVCLLPSIERKKHPQATHRQRHILRRHTGLRFLVLVLVRPHMSGRGKGKVRQCHFSTHRPRPLRPLTLTYTAHSVCAKEQIRNVIDRPVRQRNDCPLVLSFFSSRHLSNCDSLFSSFLPSLLSSPSDGMLASLPPLSGSGILQRHPAAAPDKPQRHSLALHHYPRLPPAPCCERSRAPEFFQKEIWPTAQARQTDMILMI